MKRHDKKQPEREESAATSTTSSLNAKCEVGYGKPPARSQFKKGKSGNPRGRPKGKPNISTVLKKILDETVVINENGQRRLVTKLEATFEQLINQAVRGNVPASRELIKLVLILEESAARAPVTATVMDETNQRVLLSILTRFQNATTKQAAKGDGQGGNDGNPKVG